MDKLFVAQTEASPDRLFDVVSDLTTFPQWIDLVHRVEPIDDHQRGTSWLVTLRAQLGPFARSKRLRMARTVSRPPTDEGPGLVRFERSEIDGRKHAAWTMEVGIEPVDGDPAASLARCRLHYDGSMWTRLLEGRLEATAERAVVGLQRLVGTVAQPTSGDQPA